MRSWISMGQCIVLLLLQNPSVDSRNAKERREAIEQMAIVENTGAIPALAAALKKAPKSDIRSEILVALERIHDVAVASDDDYRELAAEGLGRLHYNGPELKQLYDTEKKSTVKVALAFALASNGQDKYIEDIANALDSSHPEEAEVYLFELGKYEGKLAELHRFLRSPNPKIRARMVHILGRILDPSSRELIQPLTNDPDNDVVREALAALRKYNVKAK